MNRSITRAALAAIAVAVSGAGLSVSANAQDKSVGATDVSRRVCFRLDRVDGYAPVKLGEGLDAVNISTGRDVYQLSFANPCPSIREAAKISVENRGATRQICNPRDADVVSYSHLGPAEHCVVSGLRKIEPDELASLPAGEKP